MSRYTNKDNPYFDDSTGKILPFGFVYFGKPNTDPTDQDNNAKTPYTDRELTTPADSVQTLTIAAKLPQRLYLSGAYAITVTDADGEVIDTDPYYVGESTDRIVNDSGVAGATLTAALDALLARVVALEDDAVALGDIWPIGSHYITSVNENPGSRLGFGTWVADSQGRAIVGVGTGTDDNSLGRTYAAGDTEGEYTHVITHAEMAEHTHMGFKLYTRTDASFLLDDPAEVAATRLDLSGNNIQYTMVRAPSGSTPDTGQSSAIGSDTAHNNVQPVLAVYIWRRTA